MIHSVLLVAGVTRQSLCQPSATKRAARTFRLLGLAALALFGSITPASATQVLAVSADGSTIAMRNGTLLEVRRADGRRLCRIDGQRAEETGAMALSAHGRLLAWVGGDFVTPGGLNRIRIYEASTGRLISTLRGSGQLSNVGFSPDEQLLAADNEAISASFVSVWEARSGRLRLEVRRNNWDLQIQGPAGAVTLRGTQTGTGRPRLAYAFSPDWSRLGVAVGKVGWMLDAREGKLLETRETPGDASARGLVYLGPERGVAGYGPAPAPPGGEGPRGEQWQAWIWPPAQPTVILRDIPGPLTAAAASPAGDSVALASGPAIGLWDSRTGAGRPLTWPAQGTGAGKDRTDLLRFSRDGKTLASCGSNAWLWDVGTGGLRLGLEGQPGGANDVAFAATGEVLVPGDAVCAWSAATGELLACFRPGDGSITVVAAAPDGNTLAIGDQYGRLELRDARTNAVKRNLEGHRGRITAAAFKGDGSQLATASEDGSVRLWKCPTGECLARLGGHAGRVLAMAMTPDGKWLASGSDDETVRLWNLQGLAQPAATILKNGGDPVAALAFSPDGSELAVAGLPDERGDKVRRVVRLWSVADGELRLVRPVGVEHQRPQVQERTSGELLAPDVVQLAYSPNGHYLAAAGAVVDLLDLSGGGQSWEYPDMRAPVLFSDDSGGLLAAGAAGGVLRRSPGGTPAALVAAPFVARSINWLSGGRILVAWGDKSPVRMPPAAAPQLLLIEADTGRRLDQAAGSVPPLTAAAAMPGEEALVTGHPAGRLLRVEARVGAVVELAAAERAPAKVYFGGRLGDVRSPLERPDHMEQVIGAADGTRLVLEFVDGVQLWDPRGRRLLANLGENGRLLGLVAGGRQVLTVELPLERDRRVEATRGETDESPRSPARLVWWDVNSGRPSRSIPISTPLRLKDRLRHPMYIGSLSPDARWVVLALASGGAGLWDARTGQQVDLSLPGRPSKFTFSPGGKWLLAQTEGEAGIFLDTGTGRPVQLQPPLSAASTLFFAPGERYLTTVEPARIAEGQPEQFTVRLYDLTQGQQARVVTGQSARVVFSADGRFLVAGGSGGRATLFDLKDPGLKSADLPGVEPALQDAAISADGRWLATLDASEAGGVRLWSIPAGPLPNSLRAQALPASGGRIDLLAFAPRGTTLVTAGGRTAGGADNPGTERGEVRFWDAKTARPLSEPLFLEVGPVTSVTFAPDGRRVVACSGGHDAALLEAGQPKDVASLHDGQDTPGAALFLPGGPLVTWTGGQMRPVRLRDAGTGVALAALTAAQPDPGPLALAAGGGHVPGGGGSMVLHVAGMREVIGAQPAPAGGSPPPAPPPAAAVRQLAVSGDGRWSAWLLENNRVRLERGAGAGESPKFVTLPQPMPGLLGAVLDESGRYLATRQEGGRARLWEVASGKERALAPPAGGVTTVALAGSGQRLALGGADGTVRVFDTGTGRQLFSTQQAGGEVTALALSSDGGQVAAGSGTGIIAVWLVVQGSKPTLLSGHVASVTALAFSQDGKQLASGADYLDSTVRLWNVRPASGEMILEGHVGRVISVVSRGAGDKMTIATTSDDGSVRAWAASTGEELAFFPTRPTLLNSR